MGSIGKQTTEAACAVSVTLGTAHGHSEPSGLAVQGDDCIIARVHVIAAYIMYGPKGKMVASAASCRFCFLAYATLRLFAASAASAAFAANHGCHAPDS